MTFNKKDSVRRRKSPKFQGRGEDSNVMLCRDAKTLWCDIVLDVFSSDRSDTELMSHIKTVMSYDDLTFLKALDASQDVLVEDYFHTSNSTRDFGSQHAYALPQRMQLRGIPQGLVNLVEYLWSLQELLPVEFLRRIYQIFAFPLRIDIGACEFDYKDILRINNSRDAHTPSPLLIELAKDIFTDDFVDDVIAGFVPHHGPGSVAFFDKKVLRTKRLQVWEKDLIVNPNLFICLCRRSGLPIPECFACSVDSYSGSARFCPSKMMDVPKSWKKRRLIAIEDATRMYFAHGIQSGLYYAIHRHPVLKQIVNLHDSSANVDAARRGSLLCSDDTVDLSSASDSVGFEFCKKIFQVNPRLWRLLRLARSKSFVVPGTGLVSNHIFATMGNAVCFPVLTLIVTLILLEAYHINQIDHTQCPPKVYGDDAVPDSRVTETFISLLSRYGFDVNRRKTFTGSDIFRESCGGEFIRGVDVTPLRLSRRFKGLRLGRGFENYLQLSQLATDLYRRGFMRAYRRVCSVLTGFGLLPFTQDGSIGVQHSLAKECMSAYPHVSITGYCDEWVFCSVLKAHRPQRKLRGRIGLAEWLYQYGSDCEKEQCRDASEFSDARVVAAGSRPDSYHRSRIMLNMTQTYLADFDGRLKKPLEIDRSEILTNLERWLS